MDVLEIFKNNAINNKDAIIATCKAYKKALELGKCFFKNRTDLRRGCPEKT